MEETRRQEERKLVSSAQHHLGDGPTSSLGPVGMEKEQRAGGLVIEVKAAVWLKLGLSPSRVEEVIYELAPWGCLRMVETKRPEGHWHADIQFAIDTESWKADLEESQVCCHQCSL